MYAMNKENFNEEQSLFKVNCTKVDSLSAAV